MRLDAAVSQTAETASLSVLEVAHFWLTTTLTEDWRKLPRRPLDSDLAALYGVETGVLARDVKTNLDRFPEDFMFQPSEGELENLKCQFGTSKGRGGRRHAPCVFTEQVPVLEPVPEAFSTQQGEENAEGVGLAAKVTNGLGALGDAK
ncbi:MAG: ORF6N domain-containing protein [Deferrisomatales bacterium]|nr:ORF6N domain-containing protein [Deferrisomatales bacterium]